MIGFYRVVRVLLGHVVRGRQQLVEHPWVGRCPISGHLTWARSVPERLGEESTGGRQVSLLAGQDVDDLPVLVHRPIQLDPPSGDFDLGFVDEPPVAGGVSAGPGGVENSGVNRCTHRYILT